MSWEQNKRYVCVTSFLWCVIWCL